MEIGFQDRVEERSRDDSPQQRFAQQNKQKHRAAGLRAPGTDPGSALQGRHPSPAHPHQILEPPLHTQTRSSAARVPGPSPPEPTSATEHAQQIGSWGSEQTMEMTMGRQCRAAALQLWRIQGPSGGASPGNLLHFKKKNMTRVVFWAGFKKSLVMFTVHHCDRLLLNISNHLRPFLTN